MIERDENAELERMLRGLMRMALVMIAIGGTLTAVAWWWR